MQATFFCFRNYISESKLNVYALKPVKTFLFKGGMADVD